MLAWLLDTRETHKLGDGFVKELFKHGLTYYQDIEKDGERKKCLDHNSFFKKWDMARVEMTSLDDFYITNNLEIGIDKEKGHIDLCLVSPQHKLVVILKNRYYEDVDKKRFKEEYEYVQKEYPQNYDKLYIYLDALYTQDTQEFDKEWVGLDYEFVTNYIKSALDTRHIPDVSRRILSDYYTLLTKDYTVLPQYNEAVDSFSMLSSKYGDLINYFETEEFNWTNRETRKAVKKRAYEINMDDVLRSGILETWNEAEDYFALRFYWRYNAIIDELREYGRSSRVEAEIRKELEQDRNIEFKTLRSRLFLINSSWKSLFVSEDKWGIHMRYHTRAFNNQGAFGRKFHDIQTPREDWIYSFISLDRIKPEFRPFFRNIVEEYSNGMRIRGHWNQIASVNVSQKEFSTISAEMVKFYRVLDGKINDYLGTLKIKVA